MPKIIFLDNKIRSFIQEDTGFFIINRRSNPRTKIIHEIQQVRKIVVERVRNIIFKETVMQRKLKVLQGLPGPQGKSAYQIALSNGFIGTEQQWLDSLGVTTGIGNIDTNFVSLFRGELNDPSF